MVAPAAVPTSSYLRLKPLARSIVAGEVVFFVGAGFSVDSEGLTANRLMRRLLLRLYALDALQAPSPHPNALTRLGKLFGIPTKLSSIRELEQKLDSISKLQKSRDGLAYPLQRLAERYYEVNEWMCRTYGELFRSAAQSFFYDPDFHAELVVGEQQALGETGWASECYQPIPMAWLAHARGSNARLEKLGKLLFVHTLGFYDPRVMGGTPFAELGDADFASPRLYPRHHVLARFAREGFCPALLTTNFDLLLEAAYHHSGFGAGASPRPDAPSALTALQNFDVIASPGEFFERGKAYRTATLVKLHGCAGHLRHMAELQPTNLKAQFDYLSQLIYTYREIQNWRDDSWAADYLRTLLRTRTLVFAGYSTADPVVHDTFRSIYEEMHRKRGEPSPCEPKTKPKTPPAFFLAYSNDTEAREFHGDEILRAASLAVGGSPSIARDHPHYLRFRPLGKDEPANPALDELLPWVHHRVFRLQQWAALQNELPALIARLDRPRPASEIQRVRRAFLRLAASESLGLRGRPADAITRRRLAAALAWSEGFHVALRREWARALLLTRELRPGHHDTAKALDNPLWYFPAADRPPWTAWSAVIELALRRLGDLAQQAWLQSGPDDSPSPAPPPPSHPDQPAVIATRALRPTIFIRRHPAATAPLLALTLQLRGTERAGKRPVVPGSPARQVCWLFANDAIPWVQIRPRSATDSPYQAPSPMRILGTDRLRTLPPAETIWQLALGQPIPPGTHLSQLVVDLLGGWSV